MKKMMIIISVLVVICIGFYFGYRQATSTKPVPSAPPTPIMTYDEQTAKAAEILAKQGSPKPLVASTDAEKVIDEIDRGMKANLNLVKDGQGISIQSSERYNNPDSPLLEIKKEWIMKGNKIKEFHTQSAPGSKNIPNMSWQWYTNGNAKVVVTLPTGCGIDSADPPMINTLYPFRDGITFDGLGIGEFRNFMVNDKRFHGEFNVFENSIYGGDSCYVVERVIRDLNDPNMNGGDRMQFWIDPQKGFGIVHSERTLTLNNSTYTPSSTNYEYSAYPISESSAVFWYPKLYEEINFDSTGQNIEEKVEHTLTLKSLNQNLSNHDIDILWNAGIPIYDRRISNSSPYTIAHAAYSEDILSGKEPHIPYQNKQLQAVIPPNVTKPSQNHFNIVSPLNLILAGSVLIIAAIFGMIIFRKR